MGVIARKTLRQFMDSLKGSKDQKAVTSALEAWFHEASVEKSGGCFEGLCECQHCGTGQSGRHW